MKKESPWLFFVCTFVLTWLFWGTAIILDLSMDDTAGIILMVAGVLGPLITGITFTSLTKDREGRRDYWKRVFGFGRINWKMYLVIILAVPVLHGLSILLDLVLGGSGSGWGPLAEGLSDNPWSFLFSLVAATIIPFIEELGWRGYVQDRLQERFPLLQTSLILGTLWSLWHLPLFFIQGSYQHGLGAGSLDFWLFMVGIIPLSFVISWIYNASGRTILAAILFHSMVNFTGELIRLSTRADRLIYIYWALWGIILALYWSAGKLKRSSVRTG